MRRLGCKPCSCLLMGPSGKEHLEIPIADWHSDPEITSEYVDVAVARFNYANPEKPTEKFPSPDYVKYWMNEHLISMRRAPGEQIRVGSPVGLTGLFVHHHGSSRNIPIVRSGNIAAMPDEPVSTKRGLMTAFLIEVRSIGGLSGSPVFAEGVAETGVIGLVHGHFDQRGNDPDSLIQDIDQPSEEKLNAGIAIVVPADKIQNALKPLIYADFYGDIPL